MRASLPVYFRPDGNRPLFNQRDHHKRDKRPLSRYAQRIKPNGPGPAMLKNWDSRRDYIIPGNAKETVDFATEHWIHSAERAIQQRGRFVVALSGGSTPKAIYENLHKTAKLDWSKIWLFWSDERAVPPDHADSNYRMAM